ncbi:MAG: hypothetical protein DMG57_40255 [Acidobacteria bacterium]|nr:MAG: hypothetical protein DMG57_40255 [Acidobacteriota bacterium]
MGFLKIAFNAIRESRSVSTYGALARQYLVPAVTRALKVLEFLTAFQGAPQQENYALDLGLYYLRQRLYAKALGTLTRAEKCHSDSIYLELGLSLAQVLGDDPDRAIAPCRRILAKEPNFGPARLLLVLAFYMNGENQNCAAQSAADLHQPGGPPYLHYLLTRGLAAQAGL